MTANVVLLRHINTGTPQVIVDNVPIPAYLGLICGVSLAIIPAEEDFMKKTTHMQVQVTVECTSGNISFRARQVKVEDKRENS